MISFAPPYTSLYAYAPIFGQTWNTDCHMISPLLSLALEFNHLHRQEKEWISFHDFFSLSHLHVCEKGL